MYLCKSNLNWQNNNLIWRWETEFKENLTVEDPKMIYIPVMSQRLCKEYGIPSIQIKSNIILIFILNSKCPETPKLKSKSACTATENRCVLSEISNKNRSLPLPHQHYQPSNHVSMVTCYSRPRLSVKKKITLSNSKLCINVVDKIDRLNSNTILEHVVCM